MDKIKYTEIYNKQYNQIVPDFRDKYGIDNEFIYHKDLKYSIDKILVLIKFYEDFKNYIIALNKNDKIRVNLYGNIEDVNLNKINRFKSGHNKDKIKSFTINNGYGIYIIKQEDIIYNGVLYEDIRDIMRHFKYLLFFNEYDLDKADKIISLLSNKDK